MASYSAGIFLRVETDPPIRVWAGIGDFPVPADDVETEDAIYSGMGDLVGLPELQQLINGLAQRIDLQLSGVSAEVKAMAEDEAQSVRGASVNIGLIRLGADLQPVGPMDWLWDGEADVVRTSRTSNTDLSVTRSISISVGTIHTDRTRANYDTYSAVNQRNRSPTDAACDFIRNYSAGVTKKWG